jgi:hypothetical protein
LSKLENSEIKHPSHARLAGLGCDVFGRGGSSMSPFMTQGGGSGCFDVFPAMGSWKTQRYARRAV